MFVTHDPLGNPVDRRHPWNQHTIPRPAKRDFDDKYSWTMSPRWFDGKDYLPLDTGGGPIARLWSTALGGPGRLSATCKSTGHSVQINLPRTMSRPETTFEWKIPVTSRASRCPTRSSGTGPGPTSRPTPPRAALYFVGAGARRGPGRADQDLGVVQGAGRGDQLRLHRGGPRRAVAPHGDQGRQDRQLPPVPADPVERQRPRHLRDARALRGRGAEHADLRGEPAGQLQGHRHHARGAQLRPVPALRRAHVPRRRPGAQDGALADRHARWRSERTRAGSTSKGGADGRDTIDAQTRRRASRGAARRAADAAGPQAADTAEELVSCLVGCTAPGWPRSSGSSADATPQRLQARLVADPLVESLLLVHDLHPLDVRHRIRRALGAELGHAGSVEFLGIDDDGVVHIRLGQRLARASPRRCRRPSSRRSPTRRRRRPGSVDVSPRRASHRCCRSGRRRRPGCRVTLIRATRSAASRRLVRRAHPGRRGPSRPAALRRPAPRQTAPPPARAVRDVRRGARRAARAPGGHREAVDRLRLPACALLFTRPPAAGTGPCPTGSATTRTAPLTDADWAELQIPVGIAFFFVNSALGHVVASYPSPAGVTECELDLAAWDRLAAAHPLLGRSRRTWRRSWSTANDGRNEAFLIPIDMCYSLAGGLRLHWHGFDGGAEARAALTDFLADLRERACRWAPGPGTRAAPTRRQPEREPRWRSWSSAAPARARHGTRRRRR